MLFQRGRLKRKEQYSALPRGKEADDDSSLRVQTGSSRLCTALLLMINP